MPSVLPGSYKLAPFRAAVVDKVFSIISPGFGLEWNKKAYRRLCKHMKPTLLVLAAGMGSRYGGVKQIDAVGMHNETLLDFGVYDAAHSGYGKVVFIIRKDIEKDFRERLYSSSARTSRRTSGSACSTASPGTWMRTTCSSPSTPSSPASR